MPPIQYEFETRPDSGELMEVAAGVHWLRMPLPFVLGHINLWLLEEPDGWTVVDTGLYTSDTQSIWQRVCASGYAPLKRILVTHLHPDHSGCAGWLASEHEIELWMTREEYLMCRVLITDTGKPAPPGAVSFYHRAGYDTGQLERFRERYGQFGRVVAPLPESYRRIRDGQTLRIGPHRWEVVVGHGHSPAHACLYNAEAQLIIAGDQILPTISSNVSVWPTEPAADPLADWFDTLRALIARLPADVLVLPAHGSPFRGAHARLQELIDEHDQGLVALRQLCEQPRRALDCFAALFKGTVDERNLMMATGESIAHLNYLLNRGLLCAETDADGVDWYRSEPA